MRKVSNYESTVYGIVINVKKEYRTFVHRRTERCANRQFRLLQHKSHLFVFSRLLEGSSFSLV